MSGRATVIWRSRTITALCFIALGSLTLTGCRQNQASEPTLSAKSEADVDTARKGPETPHPLHAADAGFPLDNYDAVQKWIEAWNVKIASEQTNDLTLKERKQEFVNECKKLEGKTVDWKLDVMTVRSLPDNKACIEVVNRGIRLVWPNMSSSQEDQSVCSGFEAPVTEQMKQVKKGNKLVIKAKIAKATCDWYQRGLEFPKLSLDLSLNSYSFEKPSR